MQKPQRLCSWWKLHLLVKLSVRKLKWSRKFVIFTSRAWRFVAQTGSPSPQCAQDRDAVRRCSVRQTIGQTSKEEVPKVGCASQKRNEQIWHLKVVRIPRRFVVRIQDGFWSPMPKEYKRRTSKEFSLSGTAADEGSRLGSEHAGGSSHHDEEQTPPSSVRMDAHSVPQVTITPEGSGCSREMQQKDWEEEVKGPLRRNLSSSSISSTGSSAVESEDDLLSDSESKSKGLVTLENLVDAGEVRTGWSGEGVQVKVNAHLRSCDILLLVLLYIILTI